MSYHYHLDRAAAEGVAMKSFHRAGLVRALAVGVGRPLPPGLPPEA